MNPFVAFDDLVALARERCPFYRNLYQGLGPQPTLEELPVLEQDAFWTAHDRDRREVLTDTQMDGVVLSSGGSTGRPKFSYYSLAEWPVNTRLSALSFEHTGLKAGDRVGNLFGAGELYSSFIGATFLLLSYRPGVLQFPLATHAPDAFIVGLMRDFGIDTFAGVPSRLLRLVDYIEREKIGDVKIRRLLFAGEPFFPGQRAYVERRFPGVEFRSVGYACVDSGIIGLADRECGPGEHRFIDSAGIMEIHDESTGEPIDEPGVPGKVIFTNLARTLMPIIRYPVGDRAQWLEPADTPNRKFILLGRSEEAARIAHANLHVSDMRTLLEPFSERLDLADFQMLVTNEDRRDKLTLRLAARASHEIRTAAEPDVRAALDRQKPQLKGMVGVGTIHPVALEWVSPDELITNPRTGKIRMVVDRRL